MIEEEKIQENAQVVGTYLLTKLSGLRDHFECIGDVRGKGLMVGVEMVTDKETKTPLPNNQFLDIWDACKSMGVIFGRGGMYKNVSITGYYYKFRHLGMTLTNASCMHGEIQRILNLQNACCHSIENLLYFYLLAEHMKMKIHRKILPFVSYGCETWSITLREECRLNVLKYSAQENIWV